MLAKRIGQASDKNRVVRVTVGLSLLVHVACGLAFVVVSFWRIDKLKAKEAQITFAAMPSAPPGDPAPAPARPPDAAARKDVRPKRPAETVQPTDQVVPPATDEPQGGPVNPTATTATGGTGDGCEGCDPEGQGATPFAGAQPPGDDPFQGPEPEPPPQPKESKIVPQEALDARLVSDNTKIPLSTATLSQIVAAGQTQVKVRLKLCIDESGVPSSATITSPSGFDSVDDTVRAGVMAWRYRPVRDEGRARQECAIVSFTYNVH